MASTVPPPFVKPAGATLAQTAALEALKTAAQSPMAYVDPQLAVDGSITVHGIAGSEGQPIVIDSEGHRVVNQGDGRTRVATPWST